MAAMGFGGGGEAPEVESEAEAEEAIGAVERGKEDGAPGISSSSTVFNCLVLRFGRPYGTPSGPWALALGLEDI